MNNKKLLSQYGLKWNPFIKEVPIEGLVQLPRIEEFCWRVENLVMDGGFAMITGDVGTGKSATLRYLYDHLSRLRELNVQELQRSQSSLADFYREMGLLFNVDFKVTNRFNTFKLLREKWQTHIESTLFRPVLLIDEAQDMHPVVLSELRSISSIHFDSRSIITVIICGDERLPEKLNSSELLPLKSRIRTRLVTETLSSKDLAEILSESIRKAGNQTLLTKDVINTLADHSLGNLRAMMNMGTELLEIAIKRDLPQIDEKLFLEFYSQPQQVSRKLNRQKSR